MWLLAMSSFTRSRHLNSGLPLFLFPFTDICNIFLVASSLSRLCTCPKHLNLFYLRNSAIGFTCAFSRCQHLFTWPTVVYPLAHRNMRISDVWNFLSSFLTAHILQWYAMAGFIAVLYTLSINCVGMFLSHITPVVSLHFDQGIFIVLLASFSAPPLAPMALSSPIFPSCLETSFSLNNYIGPSVSKPFCIGFLGFSVLSNPSKYVCHVNMISLPSVSIWPSKLMMKGISEIYFDLLYLVVHHLNSFSGIHIPLMALHMPW